MHTSISGYLSALTDKGRSPLTVKAARGDLLGFAAWWESRFSRPFDPALPVGFDSTKAGRPLHPGINQRLVQRVVEQRAHEAAQRLRADAEAVASLERVGKMLDLAQRLEAATPQTMR